MHIWHQKGLYVQYFVGFNQIELEKKFNNSERAGFTF